MARIPIAEIPGVGNVPGAVVSDYPGYRVNMPDIGPGPASANAALGRVGAAGMQQQISENAFSAPGQAMEQAGFAVAQTSSIFAQLSDRLATSKNYADVARAESIMDQAKAQHAIKIAQLPEDQWASVWETEFRPEVEKQISALNLSPWSADRVNPQWIQFDAKTRTGIAHDVHKQKMSRDNQDMLNRQNKAFDEGRYEEVAAIQQLRIDAGHINDEQGEAEMMKLQETIRERVDLQTLNETPSAAKDDLREAMKTGESKLFPHLKGRPDLIRRNLAIAESNERDLHDAANEEIEKEIYTGALTDPETAQSRAMAAGLPMQKVKSLVAAAKIVEETTPAGIAKTLKMHSELMTMVEGYDPSADPRKERASEIRMMIHYNMPPGLRDTLTDELDQRRRDGAIKPDSQLRSEVFGQIDKQASLGVFGQTKKSPKDDKEDPALQQAVFKRTLDLKTQFRQWHKDNPKATPEQVQGWFTESTNRDIIKSGVKISAADRFNAWDLFKGPGFYLTSKTYDAVKSATRPEPLSMDERIRQVDEEIQLPYDDQGNPNVTPDADPNGLIP